VAVRWPDIAGKSPMLVAGYGLGSSFGSSQPPSADVIAITLGMRPTFLACPEGW
jgi:hypothetical protein